MILVDTSVIADDHCPTSSSARMRTLHTCHCSLATRAVSGPSFLPCAW